MRNNFFICLLINIFILSSESGCLILRILLGERKVTQEQPVHKNENDNLYRKTDTVSVEIHKERRQSDIKNKQPVHKNENDDLYRKTDTVSIEIHKERRQSDIKNEKSVDDEVSKISSEDIDNYPITSFGNNKPSFTSNTVNDCTHMDDRKKVDNSNIINDSKKRAKNFIAEYFSYTSKTVDFGNDYSIHNYNNFEEFIENFVEDTFVNIDKVENSFFLYFCIINFFNSIRSPKSGTYAKEFESLNFVKDEINVKMRNLILMKILCDVLDLNVISQDVKKDNTTVKFYTFISSYNIKSLFNYLTPENFSKFFFDEDYFNEYKRQLENLKKYKEISNETHFYNNNVVIRSFLKRFEIFKTKDFSSIENCKDVFSMESLVNFFIIVRKIIFHTSHLFMKFLYGKFGHCFLPLEKVPLEVTINSNDDFSKILNAALKKRIANGKEDLYKKSYYNDAAKNCISVIRNTILVLDSIKPINKFVNNIDGRISLKFAADESNLANKMGICPLEWLLKLIDDKDKVYTMSNGLTSLYNLYGQHKFLHYYLKKDDKNTIFPIQNKFCDGFLKKKKPIYVCYKDTLNFVKHYDDIFNFKSDGLNPEISTKTNSLFAEIIYK